MRFRVKSKSTFILIDKPVDYPTSSLPPEPSFSFGFCVFAFDLESLVVGMGVRICVDLFSSLLFGVRGLGFLL